MKFKLGKKYIKISENLIEMMSVILESILFMALFLSSFAFIVVVFQFLLDYIGILGLSVFLVTAYISLNVKIEDREE